MNYLATTQKADLINSVDWNRKLCMVEWMRVVKNDFFEHIRIWKKKDAVFLEKVVLAAGTWERACFVVDSKLPHHTGMRV